MRVVYDDGWGLVRASNTQPSLVLRFESTSKKRLDQIKADIEKTLAQIIKTIH
jgi:phosphomannomutase/phosphoglucomutase